MVFNFLLPSRLKLRSSGIARVPPSVGMNQIISERGPPKIIGADDRKQVVSCGKADGDADEPDYSSRELTRIRQTCKRANRGLG